MNDRQAAAKARARAWLEYAASQYPDHRIPAELGGAWLTEISIKTGCEQPTVERLAREMRVWTSNQHDVHVAQRAHLSGDRVPAGSEPGLGSGPAWLTDEPADG